MRIQTTPIIVRDNVGRLWLIRTSIDDPRPIIEPASSADVYDLIETEHLHGGQDILLGKDDVAESN